MKKLFENWKDYVNEVEGFTQWSVRATIRIKKPEGAAAVIDNTLTIIRAIEGITVVNSETTSATEREATVELEFKFTPQSSSVFTDIKAVRKEIFRQAPLINHISDATSIYSTKRRVR
jgi:hypothetical protein